MSTATARVLVEPGAPRFEMTLDLNGLAQVPRGERINVEFKADRTQELFQQTLHVLADSAIDPLDVRLRRVARLYTPEHADLRQRFLFAETIGSYSALHDLLNGYSPAYQLFSSAEGSTVALSAEECAVLESYRDQIHAALLHANDYLRTNLTQGFTAEELSELNKILLEARTRFERVNVLLGTHLIRGVERAVWELNEINQKLCTAHTAPDGMFLVDSEVMFVPTNRIIACVNVLFNAIGNSFVAQHIDGLLLLAARNLLISIVTFHAYYGREQIFKIVRKPSGTLNPAAVAHYVRQEVRELFKACKSDNRLILRRVMDHAERRFELSVEALRADAETSALRIVEQLLPSPPPMESPPELGFFKRLLARVFG